MTAENYVININTEYRDDNGNRLIWANDVQSVFYYDATVSGVEDGWSRSWSYANVVVNNKFDFSEPGSSWELVTDDVVQPYTFELSRFANWQNTDLLENMSVTSSGQTVPYYATSIVDYDYPTGWETADGVSPGQYAVTIDMGSVQDLNYFWFIPCWGTDVSKAVRNYRVGISSTGGENDFNVVASGTTVSGSYTPVIESLGNVQAQYVKLYIDSNWGHSTRSRVFRTSAFYNPDWAMYGYHNDDFSGGTEAYWQQVVDLANVDSLYFDARAYMSNSAQVGNMYVVASGVGGSTNDTLKSYSWADTGAVGWLDANDANHWTRREEQVDVSGYTGSTALKLKMFSNPAYARYYFFGYFDNIYTQPLWYREPLSEYRGTKAKFPDETYIVSDREGVSIIDKADTSLWMRFIVGPGHVLESNARQAVAYQGCVYLATTRGLIIIDFENNRSWKIDEDGVYYRMSLGRRNEYGMWFEETTAHKLPSNDVYSVSVGTYGGEVFVAVGHGSGMSFVNTPCVTATRTVTSSLFTYPVRKVKVCPNESSSAERIMYVGGYGLKARMGILTDISAIKVSSFDEHVLLLHSEGLYDDLMSNGILSQWEHRDGNIPLSFEPGCVTISGVKTDYGSTTIVQKELVPDQPFVASLDVKIDRWPERGEGGFHFGVTSGWPVSPILYEVTSQALSLSAINGICGAIIEDEKFTTFPDPSNWKVTLKSHDNSQVLSYDNSLKLHAYIHASASPDVAYGSMLGHMRIFDARTFTAKVKVKVTRLDLSTSTDYRNSVIFGISDGSYLGEGSGTHILGLSLYSDITNADPPVYCIAYTPTFDYMYWDITTTLPTFSGDMTDTADWHQWEFTYNASTETINAAIDGMFVGEYTYAAMGGQIGIVMGVAGVKASAYTTVYFKDFEIDFGANPPQAVREYVVQAYDDGIYTIPTVSGTHLNGLPFDTADGTYASNWKTWVLNYDGYTLSGTVGGEPAGSPVSLGLGNNNERIFVHYDQSVTASGTSEERTVDIKIRNFTINYTSSNVVLDGSPNAFWLESGNYLSVPYNSLYVATTSGIQQLNYLTSATISGSPTSVVRYGIQGSNFGYETLYGSINNTSVLEVEPGAVVENGLLYAGSSRYGVRGWERLINRAGDTAAGNEIGINVSPDGSRLYQFYFAGNPYMYYLDTNSLSSAWRLFTQSDYPSGFSSINGSRGYIFDMEDGNLYCFSAAWSGVYIKKDTRWLLPDENLATGPVMLGGDFFGDWEFAPIYPKRQIYLLFNGQSSLMFLKDFQWTSQYRNDEDDWWSEASACVYSDVDDSIYALRYGTANNFHRMPMDTLVFSEPLPDCPLPYDFDYGISAFYRPYDESVYFIMRGSDQAYGRRLLRYDVKRQAWSTWGADFPATVYNYMTATYAFEEDALYVIAGTGSTRLYKYYFPYDVAPRFVSWESSENLLPENSLSARFIKVDFNSEAGNPSDAFNDSSIAPQWFQNVYGTSGAITEGSNYINMVCSYLTQDANTNIIRAVPVPACDFVLTANVRINNMSRSTGAAGDSRNMFMIGVTDFIGTPGLRADSNDVEMGFSMVGLNGIFMTATNDVATDINRYSLYRAELTADTYYNTSQYQPFFASDASAVAEFHEWRIEYDHSAGQLDAYIDSVAVGTASFVGEGFQHGASVYVGCQRNLDAVSGTLNVDVKNMSIAVNSSTALVSNYMQIDDADYNGQTHYVKYDSTIVSGTGYAFESDWRVETYSLVGNNYVTSFGSMEDGQKQATLAAIYTGDRQVGLYIGGDPRDSVSYSTVSHDWTVRTTYKITSDMDTLNVFIDGSSIPSISVDYGTLPNSVYRRCRFGSLNPAEPVFLWASSRDSNVCTISGSWVSSEQESAYYGRNRTLNTTSVDDKVILYVNDNYDSYLYMFYSVAVNRSAAVPITVYHSGVLDTPVPDSFVTNPLVSVSDNVDEYGNSVAGATTVVLSQERYADGSYHTRPIRERTEGPSGWVYLGRYSSISNVVVTCNGAGGGSSNYVDIDTFMLKYTEVQPQAKSVSRVYGVGYTLGETSIKHKSDYTGGFTLIDMNTKTQIDAYGDTTSPSIVDGNVNDLDVIS